ncbi:MAG: hypothetical protein WD768_14275 [Phycisphaeraceae bacterium]
MRLVFAIFVGFCGIALVMFGVRGMLLSAKAGNKPQTISCEALAKFGPESNPHVIVTDFHFSPGTFVHETNDDGTWKTVWVPLFPVTAEYVAARAEVLDSKGNLKPGASLPTNNGEQFSVLLKSMSVQNEAELSAMVNSDTIQGLIVNENGTLESTERMVLRDKFSHINPDNTCWVLVHGRAPPVSGEIIARIGVGAALILMAFVVARKQTV